ncbi:MAG: DUF167 domain-containing protein [Patescibacteria group bacterium]|jgi:hypothetical protein
MPLETSFSWALYREKLQFQGSVVLDIKVVTTRPKTEALTVMADGVIKVAVAAVPEKSKANDELCRYLADIFQVPESHVRLLTGSKATRKKIKVTL